MERTVCTMVFPVMPGNLFSLAEGKIGLQKGYLAGYGGKWDPREGDTTIIGSASREASKESGADIAERCLEKVGVALFYRPNEAVGLGRPESRQVEMHVYLARDWGGTLQETEAFGRPQRFRISEAPLDRMYPGSDRWALYALIRHTFIAQVFYDEQNAVRRANFHSIANCPSLLFEKP